MEEFWNKPDFSSLIGSKLYGIANEDSDEDIRGFVIPPIEYALGLKRFDQWEDPNSDTVIYSFKKFLEMLVNGNSQAVESLFSNKIINASYFGNMVLVNKNIFLSKKYYRNIRGFAFAEFRKARCVQLEIAEKEPKLQEAIHVISSCLNLKRWQRDIFIEQLEELTEQEIKTEVPNKKIGHNRNEDFQNFGYCRKNYCNTIRLLMQGIELLQTSNLTFPRPEAEYLKSIRVGSIGASELESLYKSLDNELEKAYKASKLPETIDINLVNEFYVDCIMRKYNLKRDGVI